VLGELGASTDVGAGVALSVDEGARAVEVDVLAEGGLKETKGKGREYVS
jgi:hypothetical protein